MIKNFHRPKQSGRAYRAPGYDTVRWRKERVSYLKEYPLCVECMKEDKVSAAVILDHRVNIASVPIADREEKFWDKSNWQGLCKPCHNSKSGKERTK